MFRDDCVLLVQRGNAPLKGEWSLPGGAVETGETLEAALRREIREETGLEPGNVRFFEIFERIIRDPGENPEYHYVLVDFICDAAGGTLCASSDASACCWVPEQSLGDYRLTEGTLAVIKRAFRTR